VDWFKRLAARVGVKEIPLSNGAIAHYYSFGDDVEATRLLTIPLSRIKWDWSGDWDEHHRSVSEAMGPVEPSPGKTLVYRIGSEAGGLENRNAADLWGIVQFMDSDAFEMFATGDYLSVYEVDLEPTDEEYLYLRRQQEHPATKKPEKTLAPAGKPG